MGSERLLQYIASLSEEEREKYRDLIEDALARDRLLAERFADAKRSVDGYSESLNRLVTQALHLNKSIVELNEKLLAVSDASQTISKVFTKGPVWN